MSLVTRLYIVSVVVFFSCTSLLSDKELKAKYQNSLKNQDWLSVVLLSDEILKRTPKKYDIYFNRAIAKSHLIYDNSEVIADLEEYLKYEPKDDVARFINSQIYFKNKDYQEAINNIDTIIKNRSKTPFLLTTKGNYAFFSKKFKVAEEAYNERFKLPGKHEELKDVYGYLILSKYFGGNKEGALWDTAFMEDMGFGKNDDFFKKIQNNQLVFEDYNTFKIPDLTISEIGELLSNNCSELDVFRGTTNYFRSDLMEEIAHVKRIKHVSDLKLLDKRKTYVLNLSALKLKELPKELFKFVNLQALDISGNNFSSKEKLIEDLNKLPNLKVLSFNWAKLKKLPKNIHLLKQLEVLDLASNRIEELDESIGELTKLKLLSLTNNRRLKDLPVSIKKLKCLTRLDVSGTGLTRLRDELAHCSELVSISANASKIKTISEGIGSLINLKHLNLAYNKIEVLPNSIGTLNNLQSLQLASNNLVTLPSSIAKLQELHDISLEYNKFKKFPKEVLKLDKLYNLWVHNNSFKEIPISVAKMKSLGYLLVDHEVITDKNIQHIKSKNPKLYVIREDCRKYVKGAKRK